MKLIKIIFLLILLSFNFTIRGQYEKEIFNKIENKVIKWRHHIHQNPELSNREFETAKFVSKHLKSLGIKVTENVAHTGVVGILKGTSPGKVLALRADMDALPVTERNNLPYKSTKTALYNNQKTGIMHACGHDTHVAILMGVAELLSKNNDFPGTIKFIFQPAEEGPPPGEEGGAKLMIKEGVLENPKVDAIFGLHINSGTHVGKIKYKPGGMMASSQRFVIKVKGKQAHGSRPWQSVDPITISAQIINSLQTLVSRESELTKEAVVISVGSIHSGIRFNIIPEELEMIGTIRTLDKEMKEYIRNRIKNMVPNIANAYRASASVEIVDGADITYNDPMLTKKMIPSLEKVVGEENVIEISAVTGAEDFSYFQSKIPGFYFFLGGTPLDINENMAPSHHTPDFFVDDKALIIGVKALTQLSIDYLSN